MKKLLTTAICATILSFSAASAMAEPVKQPGGSPVKAVPPIYKFEDKGKPAFDKGMREQKMKEHQQKMDERLNLTPEQKTKAEKNRLSGQQKMKPVMEKIKAKKGEIRKIRENEALTDVQKQQKIAPLKSELKSLKTQANEIREKNLKDFEAILTSEQKTEFEKIKAEGKAKREAGRAEHKKGKGHGPHEHKGCKGCDK